jgi:hypothetical protein
MTEVAFRQRPPWRPKVQAIFWKGILGWANGQIVLLSEQEATGLLIA